MDLASEECIHRYEKHNSQGGGGTRDRIGESHTGCTTIGIKNGSGKFRALMRGRNEECTPECQIVFCLLSTKDIVSS